MINLRGVILGTKYMLPQMVKAGGADLVINQASIAGLVAIQAAPPLRVQGGRDRDHAVASLNTPGITSA